MPDTTDSSDWAARFSQSIAREVRRNRELRGMSAQQLSDECGKLGLPIHRSVISNFENGRRGNLTIPELLVIARALGVGPIFLLFPVGFVASMEALPGQEVAPLAAMKWFASDQERSAYFRDHRPEDMIPYRLVLDEAVLVKSFKGDVLFELHIPGKAQSYIDDERAWTEKSIYASAEARRLKARLREMEQGVEPASPGEIAGIRRKLEEAVRRKREVDDEHAKAYDLARTAEMFIEAGGIEARIEEISAIRREMAKRGMLLDPLPPEIAEFFDEEVR